MPKLPAEDLQLALQSLPEWQLDEGMLIRHFQFPTFAEAMHFINQVAAMAESADHHPDLDIRYNKVRVALISHDVAGITNRDVKLALRIDRDLPITT